MRGMNLLQELSRCLVNRHESGGRIKSYLPTTCGSAGSPSQVTRVAVHPRP